MQTFSPQQGTRIIDNLITVIQENKQYLSDIDGLIGDGDHGINMNKGFTLCREELDKNPGDLVYSVKILAKILLMEIGGSMGPLYGKFFRQFAVSLDGKDKIGKDEFGLAIEAALHGIQTISTAKPGDKTLMDVLVPAVEAYKRAVNSGKSFSVALDEMVAAARAGRDSTIEMLSRVGRSSRLGERSKGVMDAGAASCYLILESMARSIRQLIESDKNIFICY